MNPSIHHKLNESETQEEGLKPDESWARSVINKYSPEIHNDIDIWETCYKNRTRQGRQGRKGKKRREGENRGRINKKELGEKERVTGAQFTTLTLMRQSVEISYIRN